MNIRVGCRYKVIGCWPGYEKELGREIITRAVNLDIDFGPGIPRRHDWVETNFFEKHLQMYCSPEHLSPIIPHGSKESSWEELGFHPSQFIKDIINVTSA